MTKKEAIRRTQQENVLLGLGFTRDEAESLRRISMTLHRWHELECGTDHACIVRGRWNRDTQTFDYDDDGGAYFEFANFSGKNRYVPTRDRETGAKKRLQTIVDERNRRAFQIFATNSKDLRDNERKRSDVKVYIQGDPRGAALYILRPGDVPDGKDVQSYYNRGVCVY